MASGRQRGDQSPPARRHPLVRSARLHMRLLGSTTLGLVVLLALPADWRWATRVLISWDIGLAAYIAAVGVMMARADIADLRRRAAEQDEGAGVVLLLTVAASLASLGAIAAELVGLAKDAPNHALHVALATLTILLSWIFTQVIFALHYAYEFYDDADRGLKFPGEQDPDYWDFVYFSFVIGMTFQVSDVAVTDRVIRRIVVVHGVVSFLFNTAILALMVNIMASVI
jgi:uncharacterized membrane protein